MSGGLARALLGVSWQNIWPAERRATANTVSCLVAFILRRLLWLFVICVCWRFWAELFFVLTFLLAKVALCCGTLLLCSVPPARLCAAGRRRVRRAASWSSPSPTVL